MSRSLANILLQLWFYLAFGLFQFLGAVPLLVVAFINFVRPLLPFL
jgi:hypothetical protein